jgi:superfamily II DNA/RNA helicase
MYQLADQLTQGVDLPDVGLIIQWRATCDMCTLWQRFGRAARNHLLTANALFLVEAKHFDAVKEQKLIRQAEKKRKAQTEVERGSDEQRPAKRARTRATSGTAPSPIGPSSSVAPNTLTPLDTNAQDQATTSGTARSRIEPSSSDAPNVLVPLDTNAQDGEAETTQSQRENMTIAQTAADSHAVGLLPGLHVALPRDRHTERRATYEAMPPSSSAKTGKFSKARELEPAMDDMINAATRPEFHCSREPARVFFGNDKMGECQLVMSSILTVYITSDSLRPS